MTTWDDPADRDEGERPLPPTLTVMAEHGVDDPAWARPKGHGEPVDLASLGVPADLVAALRAWNQRYEALARTDFAWPSEQDEQDWRAQGAGLAAALQRALPDVEVWIWEDGTARRAGTRSPRP